MLLLLLLLHSGLVILVLLLVMALMVGHGVQVAAGMLRRWVLLLLLISVICFHFRQFGAAFRP